MAKIRFLSIALFQCFKIPSLGSATSRRWCSYGNLVKGFEALVCPKLEGSPELAAPLRLGLSPAPQVPHAHLHPAAPSRRVVGIPCAGPEEPARGLVSRAQVIGGTLGSSRGQCAPPFPSGAGSWEQASRSPRPGRRSAPVLGGARHASSGRASSGRGRGREGRSAPSPSGRAGAPGRALSTRPPRRHPCHVAPPRVSLGPWGPVPDLRGARLHPVLC